jgi:hypothetical protein
MEKATSYRPGTATFSSGWFAQGHEVSSIDLSKLRPLWLYGYRLRNMISNHLRISQDEQAKLLSNGLILLAEQKSISTAFFLSYIQHFTMPGYMPYINIGSRGSPLESQGNGHQYIPEFRSSVTE